MRGLKPRGLLKSVLSTLTVSWPELLYDDLLQKYVGLGLTYDAYQERSL